MIMARVTRSRKIQIPEDTTALAFETPLLPDTSSALEDITVNTGMNAMPTLEEDEVATEVKGLKKAYRSLIGGGKGRKTTKGKKGKQGSATDDQTQHSTSGELDANNDRVAEGGENVVLTREEDPPKRTLRPRNNKGMASTVDIETPHVETQGDTVPATDKKEPKEESSSHSESLHTKSTPTTLDDVEKRFGNENQASLIDDGSSSDNDSFVGQIMSRSPAKPVSRIEDSVEALDQLEEVLEALDQVAMAERTVSSVEAGKRLPRMPSNDTKSNNSTQAQSGVHSNRPATNDWKKPTSGRPGYGSVRVKPTAPRQTVLKRSKSVTLKEPGAESKSQETIMPENEKTIPTTKKIAAKRPASLLPPRPPVKSTKPVTLPTFELPGEAVARRLKEQREARLAQRAASEQSPPKPVSISTPKVKSTKVPTKPSFELPGEAISRRKREALEVRLKAQEEEERKKREFKAKPILGSAPTQFPRETATSRARQSKVGIEHTESRDPATSHRLSSTSVQRLSVANLNQANMSASRAPAGPPTLSRKSSSVASGSRNLSPSEVQIQRQRAKEIYNRDAKYTEDIEREKREREAIAKRSREEAAERGRQASREWAEKQRAKKLEAEKARKAPNASGGQIG